MKRLSLFLIFVSLFVIFWQVADLTALQFAGAETVPQMRLRLFEEARLRHPDVWNNCDNACVAGMVNQNPVLWSGMARQANVNQGDLVRYAFVRNFEWGQSFENDFKRPPAMHDWVLHYVPGLAALRKELDFAPQIFVWVNSDTNEWRFKRPEYE